MAIDNPTPEEWRPVVGYEGLYEASSFGNIKSVGISTRRKTGSILKTATNRFGYQYVCLSMDGKARNRFVHVLVCEAFNGLPREKQQVNHIDGIKAHNQKENLEWVSPRENILHAYRMGLVKPPDIALRSLKGEKNGRARLTEEHVLEIRNFPAGFPVQSIAERYGVKPITIFKIRNRSIWKHVV